MFKDQIELYLFSFWKTLSPYNFTAMASHTLLSENMVSMACSQQPKISNVQKYGVRDMRVQMSCRGGFNDKNSFSGFSPLTLRAQRRWNGAEERVNVSKNSSKRSNRRFEVRARSGGKEPEGDPNSKAILDAFFLGRALAETINEQLGRALGEFISEVNQRQSEQQAQTRQFQDEVKSRAQTALQKATKEALASQNSYGYSDRTYSPPSSSSSSSLSSTNPPTSVPPEGPI